MSGTAMEQFGAGAGAIALGVAFGVGYWVLWTGRIRAIDGGVFGDIVATLFPGMAIAFPLMGVAAAFGQIWLAMVGIVVFVAGTGAWFYVVWVTPRWSRPEWWWQQEENATAAGRRAQTIGGGAATVARAPSRPAGVGEVVAQARATLLTGDVDRPAAVMVRRGRIGMVWVTPTQVVFRQGPAEDALREGEVALDLPLDEVVEVDVVRRWWSLPGWRRVLSGDARGGVVLGVLRVRTGDGLEWCWRVGRPGRLAAAIDQARGWPQR